MKNIHAEQLEGEESTKKDSLRNLWDNIKHENMCIIGAPEVVKRQQRTENLFE